MERLEFWIGKLIASRIWMHSLFCVVFVFVFSIAVILSGNYDVAFAAMLTCMYVLGCTYVGRWCGKSWLSRGLHAPFLQKFLLSMLGLNLVGAIGAGVLYKGTISEYFVQYLTFSFPVVVLFMFFGVSIALARNSLLKQVSEAQQLQQQKESELRLLLSQLSPHFLFNTLNNIYGISLTQHQRVPALLLKLSELLRYSVYETRAKFIPLKHELLYIRNYLDFEKIQTGERLVLLADIEGVIDTHLLIAPMILIIFVENAFKYAKITRDPKIFITIKLYIHNGWIYFKIENSYDLVNRHEAAGEESSGVGLHHTLKRLGLIYGNDFFYRADDENGKYLVELRLKTNTV